MSAPDPRPSAPVPTQTSTDAVAAAFDGFDAILAGVVGHRKKAIDAGFPAFIADQMALALHQLMVTKVCS